MFCDRCEEFWKAALSIVEVAGAILSTEDIRWRRHESILHRSIRELKAASELRCRICRAIYQSPTAYERDTLLGDEDESLNILLKLDPQEGPYPVLSACFTDAKDNAVRIPWQMIAACDGILTDGEYQSNTLRALQYPDCVEELAASLDRSTHMDNSSTGSDAALELAAFWLKRCLSTHELCRPRTISTSEPHLPTRLLDVAADAVHLIDTSTQPGISDPRYIALSHCWGKYPIIRTLKKNYENQLKGIAACSLSQTFKDAVDVTRKLGFRYLWIDSLCIIQDDKADWQTEAATMCDVYRNATLTIAAAHAASGDVGCFEQRDGILQFPFVVEIPRLPDAGMSSSSTLQLLFTAYGRGKGLGGPEPPLYGRAWVLQEQYLSPRMLIFDGTQIRWECLCMHGSERTPLGGMSRHIGHQKAIRSGIMEDSEFFEIPEIEDRDFAALARHQQWCYAVMDYTHRGMTNSSDRLVAIDGIAKALARRTQNEYLVGLWRDHLWIGLLWSIPHTGEFTTTTMGAFNLDENHFIRHKEQIAPSWSWVSVTAPVVYSSPDIVFIHRICEVLSTRVTGSAAKQEGTLKIQGHVRTGYVNSIYQYAIREASIEVPEMTYVKPSDKKDLFTYRGRSFHPNDFFIFSETKPTSSKSQILPSDWGFVRGRWRPDEVLNPQTQLTFIAIAQRNDGTKEGSLLHTYDEQDPLRVYSIGLVPTGRTENEYRRVGYGVWDDCSWYGYQCGRKTRPGREIERSDGWRGIFAGRDLEKPWGWGLPRLLDGKGKHDHRYSAETLPDLEKYNKTAGVQERTLIIV